LKSSLPVRASQDMTEPPPNSIHPKSRAEWRQWLEQNHTRAQGIWLISFKKGAAKRPETRAKRIEETASLAAENIRVNQWRQ